ncbi:hypothetical protein [Dyella solisilvae]|nr:hypothetical protein [Dyella solisilvae]
MLMSRKTRWLCVLLLLMFSSACAFQEQADAKFGDQHFKTAIALIELYKIRHGSYPDTLDDLTFTGVWDAIALNSVHYKRLGEGYQLDISRGWVGKPALSYPSDFWKGLGIIASNVGGAPHSAP